MPRSKRRTWRGGTIIEPSARERSHCVSCDEPGPSVMCEVVRGVTTAFYHYCPIHWYAPAANGGPSAAERTGVDVPMADVLELLEHARHLLAAARDDAADYERRWLAECRAHGDTKRQLASACHELNHHVHCDPKECEGYR